jgi:ABC-2 type transport system permease protein
MAGVTDAATYGPMSAMAREQYAALASMRWSMFRHGVRSTKGALELGARVVTTIMFSLMGLGIAFGLGAGAYQFANSGKWEFLPILFWAVFVLWQVVPVTMASFQQQFEMNGLLRFPVSFATFYILHLLFGLIDASTIVGGFCCAGLWVGITLARPELWPWTTSALLVFAAFNVFLVRAIFAWIDRWLAQRRTREIVMAVFFVLILGLQLLNPALRQHSRKPQFSAETRTETIRWLHTADAVQQWLPPGLAERMVQDAEDRAPARGLEALGLLGLFAVATGATLGARLRAEYRGENLGDAPSRVKEERRRGAWLIDGSGPIAAVMEKELRTLMRAIPLLYQIGSPLVVVFVLTSLNRNRTMGFLHLPLGLLLSLSYVTVGFTQMIYNNLGGEGAGVQILFLSPTPIRTVILAKNLFHALVLALDAFLVSILACWRFGIPAPDAIAASASWFLFALPVHLAVGNIFSLAMPYKINMGRIGRQKGAQGNALLSMLVQAGTLALGIAVFAVCALLHRLWMAVPVFLLLAAGAVFAWLRILGRVDQMANARRDDLISTLVKAE